MGHLRSRPPPLPVGCHISVKHTLGHPLKTCLHTFPGALHACSGATVVKCRLPVNITMCGNIYVFYTTGRTAETFCKQDLSKVMFIIQKHIIFKALSLDYTFPIGCIINIFISCDVPQTSSRMSEPSCSLKIQARKGKRTEITETGIMVMKALFSQMYLSTWSLTHYT